MAYSDRWERQKRYLLRNFLVNPGFQLSPIAEERSSSRSSSRSSLPELVVEPEPDRHDDSEEFYCGLERRMRRYYRQLFLGETGSDDEDSTEFDVNQSMTSTFIIDNENIEGIDDAVNINQRVFRDLTNEYDEDEMITEYQDIALDAGLESHDRGQMSIDKSKEFITIEDVIENPKFVETRSGSFPITNRDSIIDIDLNKENEDRPIEIDDQSGTSDKTHDDMYFNEGVLNEMQYLSKSKIKSDTDDSIECHITSTTVAQIHERPVRSLGRLDEDFSPVLMPRSIRVSRGISEADDLMKTSESLRALQSLDETMDKESSDNVMEFEKDGAPAPTQGPYKEVRRLLTTSEVTKVTDDSNDSDKLDPGNIKDVETDRDHEDENNSIENQGSDSDNQVVFDKNLQVENKILRKSQHDETIGPDEFEYSRPRLSLSIEEKDTQDVSNWDNNETDDSFEIALRKGVFETKNARKAGIDTDEEMESSSDDCEPVEEIRAPRDVGVRASFRVPVVAEDSPMLAFETQANADKLEEVTTDSDKIDASLNTEGQAEEHHTPSLPGSKVLSALDDFWSVSPVDVDIQEVLNKASYQNNSLEHDDIEDSPKDTRRLAKDTPSQDSTNKSFENDFNTQETEEDVSQDDIRSEDSEVNNNEELPNDETQYEDDGSVHNEVDKDVESPKYVNLSLDSTTSAHSLIDDNEELPNDNYMGELTAQDVGVDLKESTESIHFSQDDHRRIDSNAIEELPKKKRSLDKRSMNSETEEIPKPKRRRKDMAIQTSLNKNTSRTDRPMSWNDIKADFFVGTPLVLKLCGCEDHVCSKLANHTN